MNQPASSSAPAGPKPVGRGCVALIGLPILAIGIFTLWAFLNPAVQSLRARSWVEQPCTVLSVSVDSKRTRKGGVSTETKAEYAWEREGKRHTSSRVSFQSGKDNFGSFQEDAAHELSAVEGKPDGFRCWVDPENPSEAVLYRDFRWGFALLIYPFFSVFTAIGVILLVAGLFKSAEAGSQTMAANQSPDSRWHDNQTAGIPETRSLWHSPGGRLGILWFALATVLLFASLFLDNAWTAGHIVATVIVGLILLATLKWILRKTLTTLRFGKLTFVPDKTPLVSGQLLTGSIHLPRSLSNPLRAKADVVVKITEKARKGTVSKDLARVDAEVDVPPNFIGIRVPLPEAPPSNPMVKWLLRVKAPGDGIDTSFELPVIGPARH